jgi:SecD/SecF fusion protein
MFMTGSLVVVIISLIIVPLKDPRGVDLKGGDYVTIQSGEGLSVAAIQESLQDADLGKQPIVQSQKPVGAGGEFFTIRTPFETGDKVIAEIEKDSGINLTETTIDSVGSAVGAEMLQKSALALGLGMLIILAYVTIRFEFAFALGAIVALIHDLIITIGVTTLLGREVSLITIGAFLTIAGYSINDTIVVFDRIRENLKSKRGEVEDVMNGAINSTLSRTVLTSVTTIVTVLVLYIFGGAALKDFSAMILVGLVVGTYSSIFVASPIVLWWSKIRGTNLRREMLDANLEAKINPAKSLE